MSVARTVTSPTVRPIATNLILPSLTGGVPSSGLIEQALTPVQPGLDGLLRGQEPGRGTQRAMQPGRAYDFDGSTDYIDLGSALNIGGENTIAFWIKTADTNWATFGNSGSNYFILFLTDTFYFRGGTGGGPARCAATIADEWTHLAVARTGSTIKFYINAVEQTVSGTVASGADSTFRYLGFSGVGAFLDGTHFDCRAYDSVLTLSEIQELYTLAADALPNKSTVLHLKCDDTHSTIAYDSSGNGNDGTKTGTIAASFHLESANVPWSWQNDKGYSDTLVPRDESAKTLDVLGASLDYTGKCPRNAQLIQSHCATLDKTNDFVDCGDLSASVKSIAFWIKPDSVTATTDYVIDLNGTDYITIVNGTVTINGFAAATTATYVDGAAASTVTVAWHHVVITSDTGFSASDCDIGRLEGTGFLGGSIAGVRLFSDELTAAEALSEYNREGTTLDNQIAYWPMAEGAGSTHYDVSGNDNHGTITGHTEADYWQTVTQDEFHYNASKGFGEVAYFDGSTYLSIADDATFDATTALSVSAICRYVSADCPSTHMITSKYRTTGDKREWAIMYDSAEKILIYLSDTGTGGAVWTSTSAVAVEEWSTIGFVYDGGTSLTVYRNGVTVPGSFTVGSLPASLHNDNHAVEIGSFSGGTNLFGGWIVNVSMEKRVLTADDMLALHNDTYSGTLDAEWRLAGTLVDSSTNGNDATESGGILQYHKVPAASDGTSLIRSTPSHPAGAYHNGAESEIDFTSGIAYPYRNWRVQDNLEDTLLDSWATVTELTRTNAAAEAPNGLTEAVELTPSTNNTEHKIFDLAIAFTSGTEVTFSVYAKANGYNWIMLLGEAAGSLVWFDLANAAVGTETGGTGSVEPLSDGWVRCSATWDTTGTNESFQVFVVNADAATSLTGDGASGVYVWGAKVETWHEATPYIASDRASEDPITNWAFNDAVTNPKYARTITKAAADYRADRFLHYNQILVGNRATSAETYTTDTTV